MASLILSKVLTTSGTCSVRDAVQRTIRVKWKSLSNPLSRSLTVPQRKMSLKKAASITKSQKARKTRTLQLMLIQTVTLTLMQRRLKQLCPVRLINKKKKKISQLRNKRKKRRPRRSSKMRKTRLRYPQLMTSQPKLRRLRKN